MTQAKPGKVVSRIFPVHGTNGSLTDFDAAPTGVLVQDGVDTVEVVTITNVDTGKYRYTATLPASWTEGTLWEVRVEGNISALPGAGIVDSGIVVGALPGELLEQIELTLPGSGTGGVTVVSDYYGSVTAAQDYFDNRLHEHAWTEATAADRIKALRAATQAMDNLNYKGVKAAVFTVMEANEIESFKSATDDQLVLLRAAELSQALEFPRGEDTTVPAAIVRACFEIAHSLLDGVDPDIEMENLSVISDGLSSVRTTYNRSQNPQHHLINGIPSIRAWRMIQPFLRDDQSIRLNKV